MNITLDQIEQTRISHKLISAEIDLFERELAALEVLAEAERELWAWLTNLTLPAGKSRKPLEAAIQAHKTFYEVAIELKVVYLTKLRADRDTMQALLAEVDRMSLSLPPGGKKLIVPGTN